MLGGQAGSCKTEKNDESTSPQLAAHFAEEEADSQQTERGGGGQNTGPVVMQVLPQPSCESLRITYRTCSWQALTMKN